MNLQIFWYACVKIFVSFLSLGVTIEGLLNRFSLNMYISLQVTYKFHASVIPTKHYILTVSKPVDDLADLLAYEHVKKFVPV